MAHINHDAEQCFSNRQSYIKTMKTKLTFALMLCAVTALAEPTNIIHFIKAKHGGYVTFTAKPFVEYQVQRTINLAAPVQWLPVNDYLAEGTNSTYPAKVWVSTTNQMAFFRVVETGWVLPH